MDVLYRFATLIFPERCPYCSTLIEARQIACDRCFEELKEKHTPIFSGAAGCRCVSSFAYGGKVRRMIIRVKFKDRTQYIAQIAEILADDIKAAYQSDEIDIITAVPMHKKDLRERGYNQSELLAKALSIRLDIPYLDALEKVKRTKKQHKLTYAQRRTNLSGAFKAISKDEIQGKRILIVDDIITSGQTLAACCKALNKASPTVIYCATIANAKNIYPDDTMI